MRADADTLRRRFGTAAQHENAAHPTAQTAPPLTLRFLPNTNKSHFLITRSPRTHTHTHKHPLLSRLRARLIVQNSVHRHQLVDRTLHQSQEQSKERLSGHPPAVDRLTVSLDISTLRRHNPTHIKPFHLPSNDIYTTFLRTVQH
jgi:hypothetical protein